MSCKDRYISLVLPAYFLAYDLRITWILEFDPDGLPSGLGCLLYCSAGHFPIKQFGVVGSGLSPSEIDIWWLLNKRARLMINIPEIRNTIVYLYDEKYEIPCQTSRSENAKKETAKFVALDTSQVAYSPIKSGLAYVSSIFESMLTNVKTYNDL